MIMIVLSARSRQMKPMTEVPSYSYRSMSQLGSAKMTKW